MGYCCVAGTAGTGGGGGDWAHGMSFLPSTRREQQGSPRAQRLFVSRRGSSVVERKITMKEFPQALEKLAGPRSLRFRAPLAGPARAPNLYQTKVRKKIQAWTVRRNG